MNYRLRDLLSKVAVSFFVVAVYKLGSYIPLPGIDSSFISSHTPEQVSQIAFGDFWEFVRTLSDFAASSITDISLFSLGVSGYITSSILTKVAFDIVPHLKELKKEDKDIVRSITRYNTVFLTGFVGFSLLRYLYSQLYVYVLLDEWEFVLLNTFIAASSALFLQWLVDISTEYGLVNGIGLIIFTRILSSTPKKIFDIVDAALQSQEYWSLSFSVLASAFIFLVVIFGENSLIKIPLQHGSSQRGIMQSRQSFLPLKLNLAGSIPAIGSLNIVTYINLVLKDLYDMLALSEEENTLRSAALFIVNILRSKPSNLFITGSLIFFLASFWAKEDFNATTISENLNKSTSFIPFIRPGKNTASYIKYRVDRMIFMSASFLTMVSCFSGLYTLLIGDTTPLLVDGLSLLIVVSVTQEILTKTYKSLISPPFSSISSKYLSAK